MTRGITKFAFIIAFAARLFLYETTNTNILVNAQFGGRGGGHRGH